MADNEEQVELTSKQWSDIKDALDGLKKINKAKSYDELKLTKNSIKELAKEIAEGTYQKFNKNSSQLSGSQLAQEVKKIVEENNRFSNKIRSWKWWAGHDSSGGGLQAIRTAEKISGGIDSIFSGNFFGGMKEIGQAFPKIAKFMGGPLSIALQAAVKGLITFDEALSKSTKTAVSITGGMYSSNLGGRSPSGVLQRIHNLGFNAELKDSLYNIGMADEYENIISSISKSYGIAAYKNKQKDFVSSIAYAQKGLGSFGIDANTANNIVANLRTTEGKDNIGISAQLRRLTKRFETMKYLSPERATQQITSLSDQTKMLGTNFEWANKTVIKFERELQKGTMTLSDFASLNRSFQSGGVSRNAGVAAMLSEFASRTGINLPQSFLNSNAIGRGFALSTEAMLGSNSIAKATSGKITEMLDQMGMNTKDERAGMLQQILSQMFGVNISSEAALKSLTSTGEVDLLKSRVAGTKAFQEKAKEEREAKNYEDEVRKYYVGEESYVNQMKHWVGGLYNHFVEKAATVDKEAETRLAENLNNLLEAQKTNNTNSLMKEGFRITMQNQLYSS